MLLPLLIREHYSRDCPKIGFFLHIPFPSSEVFRLLPVRSNILEGIIASDLIGFHTHDYARHFTRSSEAFLPLIASSQGIEFNGRFSRIGIYPVGIDPSIFDKVPSLLDIQRLLDCRLQKTLKNWGMFPVFTRKTKRLF